LVEAVLEALDGGGSVEEVLGPFEGASGPFEGGRASRFRDAVGVYRAEVIDALTHALDGRGGREAAWALGALHAVEVLPALRRMLRVWGDGPPATAVREVIAVLDARAALPRPAARGDVGGEGLPRVAGEPGPSTDGLPRVAEE
jgi:hypothetical protein